jgi:hypothetical protein
MEATFCRVVKGVGVVQSTGRITLGEGRGNASIDFLKEKWKYRDRDRISIFEFISLPF